jgi:hypothetical protein
MLSIALAPAAIAAASRRIDPVFLGTPRVDAEALGR